MARRKNVSLPVWCSGKLPPRQGRDVGRPGLRACGTWLHLGGILEMSPLSVGSGMPFTSGLGSIQECGGLLLSLLLTPGHSSGVGQGSLLSPVLLASVGGFWKPEPGATSLYHVLRCAGESEFRTESPRWGGRLHAAGLLSRLGAEVSWSLPPGGTC